MQLKLFYKIETSLAIDKINNDTNAMKELIVSHIQTEIKEMLSDNPNSLKISNLSKNEVDLLVSKLYEPRMKRWFDKKDNKWYEKEDKSYWNKVFKQSEESEQLNSEIYKNIYSLDLIFKYYKTPFSFALLYRRNEENDIDISIENTNQGINYLDFYDEGIPSFDIEPNGEVWIRDGIDDIFDLDLMKDITTIGEMQNSGIDTSKISFKNRNDFYHKIKQITYSQDEFYQHNNIKIVYSYTDKKAFNDNFDAMLPLYLRS